METRVQTLIFPSLLLALTCAVGMASGEQKQHVVGGTRSNGWGPNINYTVWAAGERFYVGDWLTFFYEKGYYDVMQVNETDYERCSPDHPMKNESKGNSYSFQLNHTGLYYFICSRGQCWSGMKLAIDVLPLPPPSPSLSPSTISSGTVSARASWAAAAAAAFACGMILDSFRIMLPFL